MHAKTMKAGQARRLALILALGGTLSGVALHSLAQTDCCKAYEGKAEAKKDAPKVRKASNITRDGKAPPPAEADLRTGGKEDANSHGANIDCCKGPKK